MRALVDIPAEDLKALSDLSKVKQVSRASLIRQAVSQYLKKQRTDGEIAGFGLWQRCGHGEDGAAYQDRMRREWNR